MAKQIKNTQLLLKLSLSEKTGGQIKDLPKEESKLVEEKLNLQLKEEIKRIRQKAEEVLPEKKAVLEKMFSKLDAIEYGQVTGRSLQEVIQSSLSGEAQQELSSAELEKIGEVVTQDTPSGTVESLLNLDLPLSENPLFAPDIRVAKIMNVAAKLGIKETAAEALAQKDYSLAQIDDETLAELEKKNLITAAQRNAMFTASKMEVLSGGNIELVNALIDKKLQSPAELIDWAGEDWLKLIKENKVTLPATEPDAESYAQSMMEVVESSFPTDFYLNKVIVQSPVAQVTGITQTLKPLWEKNSKVFNTSEGHLAPAVEDWPEMPAAERKKLLGQVENLRAVANTYKQLGFPEIFNSEKLTADQKEKEMKGRLNALDTFYRNNPEVDIFSTDFSADQKAKPSFNWEGIDAKLRPAVQRQMASFQRTYLIGGTEKTATRIMNEGFDSAYSVVAFPEEDFIKKAGLDFEEGRRVYRKATDMAIGAAHYFASITDGVRGTFDKLKVGNQHSLVNDLKEIDGFDKLFGNQDYCDCQHCRSVLSPAAYFTDLMYFVQENVSKKAFTGTNGNHPLYLKRRRPDLWKLRLTCENTNKEIPYLQVVTEVLAAYLQSELGIADVYTHLKNADRSVYQPFHLELESLRLYLNHFGISLADLYKKTGADPGEVHREQLKLSKEQLSVIITPDPAGAGKRFGNKPPANFNVQHFITYAGISRKQLDELLNTTFNPEISKVKVKTVKDPADIQKYSESLDQLTAERLDHIHRYVRLWRHTSWDIPEFDLVLNALKQKGLLSGLEQVTAGRPAVLLLGRLGALQAQLGLTVEELATLVYRLPETALREGQKSFASRIFNLPMIIGVATDAKVPHILAGLGISEPELQELARFLSADLSQPVTPAVLSDLYTHARLARALKIKTGDLILAAGLLLGGQPVRTLDDLDSLADLIRWVKASPYQLADLSFILAGNESGTVQYKHTREALTGKVAEIQQQEAVVHTADTAEKLTLMKNLLKDFLLTAFNLTAEQLNEQLLPALAGHNFEIAAKQALEAVFTNGAPDQPGDFDALALLVQKIERYCHWFIQQDLSPEHTRFIGAYPAALGITDLETLTIADIRNVSEYVWFSRQNPGMPGTVETLLQVYQTPGGFAAQEQALASYWQVPVSLIRSVSGLPATPVAALHTLWTVVQLCQTLGIQGESLKKLTGSDLKAAEQLALGAFSAKYPDENERMLKLEAYHDKLNTLKRDALCDYIISREDKFKFKDLNDLYAFFLLDVEMSGCFRTSYVVAAITSLQMYVMRCLTNLEQSDPHLNPGIPDIRVLPTWIPADEWEWRKNYRVWEANRKVFLYPENYIDPTLRDTKTHLFKDLEDELLQQKITRESAETAYKKYMAQFTELTRMRYAGAYYHSVRDNFGFANIGSSMYFFVGGIYWPTESEESCYYLFARTNVMPYRYFYRTYNHYKKTWGNWIPIDLGIEAGEVSPLIHQGKLYIFWSEVKNKEISNVNDGTSSTAGIRFTGYVKYAFLTENGKWSAPQRLTLGAETELVQRVYGRGKGVTSFNSSTWEKEKDTLVESYQEKVFRKPYAHANIGNKATPLRLGFIWSNMKGSSEVKYKSAEVNFEWGSNLLNFRFTVPSRTFTIINNDFSGAVTNVQVNVRIKIPFSEQSQNITGTLQMLPGVCLFSIQILNIPIIFPLTYTTESAPPQIREDYFDMSLSRNTVTNPAVSNLFSRGGSLNNYNQEYYAAYSENGEMVQFIENGTRAMTDDKLTQSKDGKGGLHIYNTTTYEFVPVHAVLTDELSDILYAKGVEEFLSLKTQVINDTTGQQLDFRGPYGEYYWEIFFHIPFLIANHFNANQKFAEAKWWYERIFNPTSDETPSPTHPTDHNWQFCEFRGLTPQKLKDILTDVKAIEAYKKDPFDPHAIARLRISSYQKSIVMKYIDNLLDWGDYLFTQDTRESINEAEILYRLALNILGDRPVKMGKCETADSLTYEKIGPAVNAGSEFLITLENVYVQKKKEYETGVGIIRGSKAISTAFGVGIQMADFTRLGELASVKRLDDLKKNLPQNGIAPPVRSLEEVRKERATQVMSYTAVLKRNAVEETRSIRKGKTQIDRVMGKREMKFEKIRRSPSFELVKQMSMVFCVPENADLMAYWDRTEDRLYKIWNCMNIKGVRRSLSLFQPPIDPMMLVRMKAAGLTLEDIRGLLAGAGQVPKYRFTYLLEKARQFTQVVQGFGAGLLSALEKKDAEELLLMRTTHEKNLQRLTREVRKEQVKEAGSQYLSAQENLANIQNRVDYYQGLIDTGLLPWEVVEQVSKWTAGSIRIGEATLGILSGVFGLLPQIGSPFSMKYGGQELKNGTEGLRVAAGAMAAIADNVAILAGMEAGNMRREQDWKQQLKTARQEHRQMTQSVIAAEIRHRIAEKELALHEQAMEQLEETHDFYKNKFTRLGLYNYLASGLGRVYRNAYNMAYDLARQAEAAYRFERFDTGIYIQNDNWQADKAGLMAGDQLMQQLMSLEKRYIETNERKPEITQSFSLVLLDAAQLMQLRQTGSCTFKIPEMAFEMFYPGQYRRVIKSVRLSVPCVAGPYTNISARLTLMKGEIVENESEARKEIDIAKNTSITTSSAQNDAGLFELSFQDERYLPFEGAGAVSEWKLELPSAIRAFDYDTIPDVIMHMSYTASDGDRVTAENNLNTLLEDYAAANGLFRLFSLKYDFPDAFRQLMTSAGQETEISLEKYHFPYFLAQKTPELSTVNIYLKPQKGKSMTLPAGLKISTKPVSWDSGLDVGLPASGKIKGGTVAITGSPLVKWKVTAGAGSLKEDEVDDLLILMQYSI